MLHCPTLSVAWSGQTVAAATRAAAVRSYWLGSGPSCLRCLRTASLLHRDLHLWQRLALLMSLLCPLLTCDRNQHSIARRALEDVSLRYASDLPESNPLVVPQRHDMLRWTHTQHHLCPRLLEPVVEGHGTSFVSRVMVPELPEEDEACDDDVRHAHERWGPGDEACNGVVPLLRRGIRDYERHLSITREQSHKLAEPCSALPRKVVVHQVVMLHTLPQIGEEGISLGVIHCAVG